MGILQILSPSQRYYRGFYPHSNGYTAVTVPITAVTNQYRRPYPHVIL